VSKEHLRVFTEADKQASAIKLAAKNQYVLDLFHTYAPLYEFKCSWSGRTFECIHTGERITLDHTVNYCDYIVFGKCGIDLGRIGYSRMIGNVKEILE